MNNISERLEQLSTTLNGVLSRNKEIQQTLQTTAEKLDNILTLVKKSSKTD